MLRIVIRVAVIAALLIAGLSAGLFYRHLQLGKAEQVHQKKINEMNKKIAFVEKKASDEREARSGMEGRNKSLQADIEKLRKENEEQAEVIKKLNAEGQSFEAKLKETAGQVVQEKAAREQVSAQLAQVLQAARELEGQAKLLASGKQTLETSLAKVNQDLDSCRNHNARLCIIADEILNKQQPRGTMGSIFQGEPLTQIWKVDLEKFTQEYKDKIAQEKLQKK